MHNILTDPLIRYNPTGGGRAEASLPEVYAALMADGVDTFPALRPHQRHAWHAFLVQLAVMAMRRDGLDEPPSDAAEWRRIIRALTPEYPDDEPWQLVVDDITKPAFMQPPAHSQERAQDYKSADATPDKLDMLVTSKNFDLKSAVAWQTGADDWVLALIALQTMEGFGGSGNYGISRMNGGLGNRPAFTLAPSNPTPGSHIRRDIMALLEHLPKAKGGHTLLWALPWDGAAADALSLDKLNPLYIEVCRRVRLRSGPDARLCATRASSKAARINAKSSNGVTGDPWALIDGRDKKGVKVLTLSAGGFNYKRVADYLTSGDYERPPLLDPTQSEMRSGETMQLVARAMVRGQGKTEGYYERAIPVRPKLKLAMLRRRNDESADMGDLGAIAQERIQQVSTVQRILSHAIQVFAARGDQDKVGEHRERARPWLNRLDEIVDARFFDDLQAEFEADASQRTRIRHRWLLNDADKSGVIDHARVLLNAAADSLPCPAIHYYQAREAAEGLFEGRLRGNSGLPDVFNQTSAEAE